MNITPERVHKLIAEQFPAWKDLPVKPVAQSGWDNRTFHLGSEMLVRLPSAEQYVAQVAKEQKWLPQLAPHLSLTIPTPIAQGKPSELFAWPWSVYRWIPGASTNLVTLSDTDRVGIAAQLAEFITELHVINTDGAPKPGWHNYYRGAHISFYDEQTSRILPQLASIIPVDKANVIWQQALASEWHKPPVWIHGDLVSDNIVVNEQHRLTAVIDFGCLGVGDPACDLAPAWVLFHGDSRETFQSMLHFDSGTWNRARGWVLWKAVIQLKYFLDEGHEEKAREQKGIIDQVLASD